MEIYDGITFVKRRRNKRRAEKVPQKGTKEYKRWKYARMKKIKAYVGSNVERFIFGKDALTKGLNNFPNDSHYPNPLTKKDNGE